MLSDVEHASLSLADATAGARAINEADCIGAPAQSSYRICEAARSRGGGTAISWSWCRGPLTSGEAGVVLNASLQNAAGVS